MSIRLMTEVWQRSPYDHGTLLVHLALADSANDATNEAYMFVETLARKARLARRATQMALREMEADGTLRAVGKHGKATVWEVHAGPVGAQKMRPGRAQKMPPGAQKTTARGAENDIASLTNRIEPSKNLASAPPKARPRKPVWDAICEEWGLGYDGAGHKGTIGQLKRLVEQRLPDSSDEGRADEVRRRRRNLPASWEPTSPAALLKWWDAADRPMRERGGLPLDQLTDHVMEGGSDGPGGSSEADGGTVLRLPGQGDR